VRLGLVILTFAIVLWGAANLVDARNTRNPGPNTDFPTIAYSSHAEWEARKAKLRSQILAAAGLMPLPDRTPLRPRVSKGFHANGYRVEAVLLETLPGFYLGGTIYAPDGPRLDLPAVLIPHGHWSGGRTENREDYSVPALGVNLARQGYVAFAYDMVGYNDTVQVPHDFGGWREQLWSFNPLGLQLWNSIRALDYLASRPDVDERRVGVTGASGGGTQTFLLAAVDDRVRVSAPVNMISAHMQGGDPCEEAPGLRLDGANNVEFAAMMAPRPMLVVSCTRDWTRNTPVEEFPAIRRIYSLFDKPGLVKNAHFDAGHNYNRDSRLAVYRFFARHLNPPRPAVFREIDVSHIEPESLLVLSDHKLPANAVDYDGLFSFWISAAREQFRQTADRESLRTRLRLALGAEWPEDVLQYEGPGEYIVLRRSGRHDKVIARWVPGSAGPPVVAVHPQGSETGRFTREVAEMIAQRRPVLVLNAFQTGLAKAAHGRVGRWFTSYNRSDDSERVQDIMTTLAWAQKQGRGTPELLGMDEAAV
jgi:dienelactone hydrolase